MRTWGWHSFRHFQLIVHIEASFGNIEVIHFDSLLLRGILSVSSDFHVVVVQHWSLVLSYVPWYIGMTIITVHHLWRQIATTSCFRIIHLANKINIENNL